MNFSSEFGTYSRDSMDGKISAHENGPVQQHRPVGSNCPQVEAKGRQAGPFNMPRYFVAAWCLASAFEYASIARW